VTSPERTTAAAFFRYLPGTITADSANANWTGLFVRRYQLPREAAFLVPATPEPLVSCGLAGTAEFEERDVGDEWVQRRIGVGDLFVTRSTTPYQVHFRSPPGQELEILQVHVAVDEFLAALEAAHPGKADQVAVVDFFGRDDALRYLCFACAAMLSGHTPSDCHRLAALTRCFAAYLAEEHTDVAAERPPVLGLSIGQLRKVERHVRAHLAEESTVAELAGLVGLSPFHFSRVFKEAMGMTPLQFVTRERVLRAQQLIRETSRKLIEIGLEVGYTSPSHFAKVFRRITGVTPTRYRDSP